MRLANFIESNSELILAEWVEFAAKSGPAGSAMDLTALRDHAQAMLTDIVADLRTPQTDAEQEEKAKGKADADHSGDDTSAQVHGALRAEAGFTLGEMISEFRALRASVIRLWTGASGSLTGADLEDLMRFNEAIDQATAESITRFTRDLDHSKEMFLAILGHDLRTPIGTVIMSSQFMLDTGELKEPHLTLMTRIARSARRMNELVRDLLDLTLTRFGSGIPIARADMDLARVALYAVEEMSTAHPNSVLRIETSGELRGEWDAARLSQVLANLLANAVQYGTAKKPIMVTVQGGTEDVVLRVHNEGPPIARADLPGLFNPLKRLASEGAGAGDAPNLGLGLYIAEQIVTAHRGTIAVESSAEAGTSFTVCLPRRPAAPPRTARTRSKSGTRRRRLD